MADILDHIRIYKNKGAEMTLQAGSPDIVTGDFTTSFEGQHLNSNDATAYAKTTDNAALEIKFRTSYDAALSDIDYVYGEWLDLDNYSDVTEMNPHIEGTGTSIYFTLSSTNNFVNGGELSFASAPDYFTINPTSEKGEFLCEIHSGNPLNYSAPDFMFKASSWAGGNATVGLRNLMWLEELDIMAPLQTVEFVSTQPGYKQERALGGRLNTSTSGKSVKTDITITFESVDETTKDVIVDLYESMQGNTYPFLIWYMPISGGGGGYEKSERCYVVRFKENPNITETQERLFDITITVREI